jgi:NADP-dependent 3-hydroxy acid dehydrogenase YdfG
MSTNESIAMVIGAASGLGRIHAQRFAREGLRVIAVDLNRSGLEATAADHPKMHIETLDVTDLAAVRSLVYRVEADVGPIAELRHTAAIMPTAPLLEQDALAITKLMRVNYEGTVHVATTIVPKMRARGRGRAVFYGSVAGHALTPHLGAYCATKAAVNAFVEILIEENRGSGVALHLVCPPMVKTPLLEQARATSNPKSLQQASEQNLLADPHDIVDRVERGVSAGTEIIFPTAIAKALYAGRRVSPRLLWKVIRRSEQM